MSVVLVTDHPAPDTVIETTMLETIGAVLRVAQTGAEDELVAMAADADAILTCFKHVTPAVVRAAPNLRVIGRYGVGVDNIAVSTASELGIPVTNVPVYCVDEVAEHALALILTLARGTALYDASVRDGAWDLSLGMPLHRIAGLTLGIIGFGHIGQAVAIRARSFGLRLLVNDRSATQADVAPFGATLIELDELIAASDIVSLHVPLTPETTGLIDARRIRPDAAQRDPHQLRAWSDRRPRCVGRGPGGATDRWRRARRLRPGAAAGRPSSRRAAQRRAHAARRLLLRGVDRGAPDTRDAERHRRAHRCQTGAHRERGGPRFR